MQSCPEDGISLQRHQLSEQVLCVGEGAAGQLGVALPFSARQGRGQAVRGVLYGSLQGSACTNGEHLAG